jgi:uncharacterized SAM-binding protein YcdF (DUF218 family)
MFFFLRRQRHFALLIVLGCLLFITSVLPIRLAVAKILAPEPQAIFMLGGGSEREEATALFAYHYPELDVWISSGASPEKSREIFTEAGVTIERVHLDYRAVDTVTNFTTMVEVFQQQGIHHVYLLTSEFHMARSRTLATLIFGFHGIIVTPIPISDSKNTEAKLKIIRDAIRAIVWLITGHSGSSLHNPDHRLREYLSAPV